MTDQPTDRAEELRIVKANYLVPAPVPIKKMTDLELGKLIGLGQGLELYAKGETAQANIRREREKYEAEWNRRCAEREVERLCGNCGSWQPIKTAPKDGSYVLLAFERANRLDEWGGVQTARWNAGEPDEDGLWWFASGGAVEDAQVLGWMPLPPAPGGQV